MGVCKVFFDLLFLPTEGQLQCGAGGICGELD